MSPVRVIFVPEAFVKLKVDTAVAPAASVPDSVIRVPLALVNLKLVIVELTELKSVFHKPVIVPLVLNKLVIVVVAVKVMSPVDVTNVAFALPIAFVIVFHKRNSLAEPEPESPVCASQLTPDCAVELAVST